MVLSLILYGFFTKRYNLKVKLITFISISIVGLQILTYFFSNILNRFTELSADYSAIIRIYAIYHGISYFIQNPILGWGTGSFATLVNDYIKYPHNIFVELAMEVGLIGVILFSIFLLIVIYNLFSLRNKIEKDLKKIGKTLQKSDLNYIFRYYDRGLSKNAIKYNDYVSLLRKSKFTLIMPSGNTNHFTYFMRFYDAIVNLI